MPSSFAALEILPSVRDIARPDSLAIRRFARGFQVEQQLVIILVAESRDHQR